MKCMLIKIQEYHCNGVNNIDLIESNNKCEF